MRRRTVRLSDLAQSIYLTADKKGCARLYNEITLRS